MADGEIETALRSWLTLVDGPTLYFPWGWFGRPYDNAQTLSASMYSRRRFALEFDESVFIIASRPGSVVVDSPTPKGAFPVASANWTTITIDQVALLTVISSNSAFEADHDIETRSEQDSFL